MNTRLFINDTEIDIDENVVFPLSYSQSDAKDPSKRKRNSSKSINLPGTKKNNKFFMSCWDLSISDVRGDSLGFDFDPTLKYPAKVLRNGKEIFRGTVNLTKVVQTKFDKATVNTFQILLYSEITNMMQALGDITVAELGWSEYNHTLSIDNIEDSWGLGSAGSGYFYPLIDFGFTDDTLSYKTNELRPYIYKKEIIEKCFALIGATMSSTFWNNFQQKKICWGFGGGTQIQLSSLEVNQRRSKYTGDGSASYTYSDFSPQFDLMEYEFNNTYPLSDNDVIDMTVVQDINSQYDESTGEFVIFNDGDYKLDILANMETVSGFTDPTVLNQNIYIIFTLRIFKNFGLIKTVLKALNHSATATETIVFNVSQEIQADAGDIISASIEVKSGDVRFEDGFKPNVKFDLDIDFNDSISMDLQAINIELIDGDLVEVSRFLPNVKAADFMQDIILMYNMYMSDPDKDNVITFEPEDIYFFETDDVDQWSNKVDRSSKVEIEPASNIQGKIYSFRFAEDRDYYKQRYFDQFGIDYGDYNYNVPSTFKTGTKLYQLKMAQSCPVQIEGSDLIIPRILKLNETTLVTEPHKGKARFFFNNGLQSCDPWNLVNSDTGAITTKTTYPLSHHLNNLTSPTKDLNFGVPQYVFYNATSYTSSNLFSVHHAQSIRELTSRDSKILTTMFKLDESDLYENFMRRLCNIDGVLYRKNIVKDFRATSNETTKVELVKIVKGNTRKTYSVPTPTLPLSAMSYGGDPNAPITKDINAKSFQKAYNLDTSVSDLIVTVDPETIRQGWVGEFKKLDSENSLIIQVPKLSTSTIDGEPSIELNDIYDSATLYFDGVNFKIIASIGSWSGDHHSGFYKVDSTEVVTISSKKQMTNWNKLTNNGTIKIDGQLILR